MTNRDFLEELSAGVTDGQRGGDLRWQRVLDEDTAELLQAPAVRASFGLEALPPAAAACDGAVKVVDFGAAQSRGKKGFSC